MSRAPGRIVILNGAPRSGKSTLARLMGERLDGAWINLGVDTMMAATPERYLPAIGLRPGGERPDLEPLIARLNAALFDSMAAHARHGIDVVADLGLHDGYSRPLDLWEDCAARLAGLPVLLVGVFCPIEIIMARRNAGQSGREGQYLTGTADEPIPAPVRRWQEAVHRPGIYDLTVDTGAMTPESCLSAIVAALADPPDPPALTRLRGGSRPSRPPDDPGNSR